MTLRTEQSKPSPKTSRRRIGFFLLLGVPWVLLATLAFRGGEKGDGLAMGAEPSASPVTTAATSPSTVPVFSQSADVTEGEVGAWGQMQYVPIVLEMPEAYATVAEAIAVHDRWNFAFRTREEAIAMMAAAGVTSEQLALIPADAWRSAEHAVSVVPTDAFLLAISTDARAKLYPQLMDDPANDLSIDPVWFRVGRVDFRLRSSGLSEASMALLKRLLYPGPDEMLLFNDEKAAIRSIKDPEEQARFLKAIERKRTLAARLILTGQSDTESLAKYWGKGGREANLLPLLDSVKYNAMAGVENPGRINILSLLPPFAQQRLYRHADVAVRAGKIPEDCFWTAFNFFSDTPDDGVHDVDYLVRLLRRDYVKIDAPSELGDVILIGDAKGQALHAANYLADNFVFTKNGTNSAAPWILSPMRDLIDTYRIKHDPITVAYYRKRDLMPN